MSGTNNMNSRRSSNNHFYNHMGSFDNQTAQPRLSAKRKRSTSIEHSREEKKSLNATAEVLSKKRTSLAKQSTPASSRKGTAVGKPSDMNNASSTQAAGKAAK